MKTGAKRRVRHRASACVALALAVTLPLALTACDDHSPVAAPTSTLPAQDPADDSSGETDKPSIPEYDTELDLNDEEKEAVEGALVAFEGYIETINRVFSSGGKDDEDIDRFARDGSLDSIKSEAKRMQSSDQYMAGKYKTYDIEIEEVDSVQESVSILFCTKDSEWQVVDEGKQLPSNSPKGITMQHVVTFSDEEWKVANQYLRSKTCDSL
ncbi:hypothetical protein ACH82I_03410 [Brevibacterium sp. GP-SGM9]|uniref:hypothetical protein n=1 Tax=Brevibacterium sp. GP-SGM9 TaxID=3376990 RepID=UPI0039A54EB6